MLAAQAYITAAAKDCVVKRAWDTAGKSVTPPVVVRCAIPRYPPELMQREQEGSVIARMVVDSDGVPDSASIHIVELTGDSAFEQAVRAALPYMRFAAAEPGDARPVIVETTAKFTTTHYH